MSENKRGAIRYVFNHPEKIDLQEEEFKVGQLVYYMKYEVLDRKLTFQLGMIVLFVSELLAEVLFESQTWLIETEYLVSLENYELLMQEKSSRER